VTLLLAHVRVGCLELLRQPQYWLPSLSFPFFFFALFGISGAPQVVAQLPPGLGSEVILAQFLCFGLLTIMFFQFGVGIAEDRRQPWEVTLRALPASGAVRFGGRVGVALVFSFLAVIPVSLLAALTTELRLSPAEALIMLAAVLLGAIPFGLMGITLGFAASPRAALPIANLAFLGLSFLGGLFLPADALPDVVAAITPWLPSRHYLDAVQASTGGPSTELVRPALYLLGWAAVFLAAAVAVYRRDEGARYR
jgi:ABC-2 type transport system permease protein